MAFQTFQHADIEHTMKRAPGVYHRDLGAEEKYVPSRLCRGRPQSAPPRPLLLEAPWSFHHTQGSCNERRHGPRLYSKAAAETTYDKVTASLACDLFGCTAADGRPCSKRGVGKCSPQESRITSERSRASVARDLHSQGALDIDRTLRRGSVPGSEKLSSESTAHGDHTFSEEREAALKRSLSESPTLFMQLPDYIEGLDNLGFECRRLITTSLSCSDSQNTLGQLRSEGLETSEKVSVKFTPVRRRSSKACSSHATEKPQAAEKHETSDWINELGELFVNVNRQRLQVAYSKASLRSCQQQKGTTKKGCCPESVSNFTRPELFLPTRQRCNTDSTKCSATDEEELVERRLERFNFLIPKLPLHMLEAGEKPVGCCADCSDCSTHSVVSGQGADDSDDESCRSSCESPPPAPRQVQAECVDFQHGNVSY